MEMKLYKNSSQSCLETVSMTKTTFFMDIVEEVYCNNHHYRQCIANKITKL